MAEVKFLRWDDSIGNYAEHDIDNDTISIAGLAMGGNITMANNEITGLPATPTSGTSATSKTYVDNLLSGLQWSAPIDVRGLVGNGAVATLNGLTPTTSDAYVVTDSGTLTSGSVAVTAGDLVQYDTDADEWVLIVDAVGGFPPDGTRVTLSTDTALISPYTDATDDGKLMDFDGTTLTGANTSEATAGAAVLVIGVGSPDENSGYVFDGAVPTGTWIQFTGAGQIVAGNGLDKDGNTLSVNVGNGLAIDTDNVVIDLTATPGLEFSGGDLQVKTSGANGIVLSANGVDLEIDDSPDTLDVDADGLKVVGLPSLFKINDVAVSSTVTAANLDDLTDGSNADSLHVHATSPATEAPKVEDTHTNLDTVTSGKVVRWSATADKITHAANDSTTNKRAIGVARTGGAADGTSEVVKSGICEDCLSSATPNVGYYLGTAGALVVRGSVPRPGHFVRIGFSANADDLDVQIQDYGYRRAAV